MLYTKQFVDDILKQNLNLKKENEFLKKRIHLISTKLNKIAYSNPLKQGK